MDTRPAIGLVDRRLDADLQHQLLPRAHARSAGTLRGGVRPLRRHGAVLARMAVLRKGENLRRRPLVRRTDRPGGHGGPLQTARQPRIRHGPRARGPRLRLRTLLRFGRLDQLGPDQPLHRAGLQVPRMPVRRHLPEVPFRRSFDRQTVGGHAGLGTLPARRSRSRLRTDAGRHLLDREQPGQRPDAVPQTLHRGGDRPHGDHLGPRNERRHDHLPRPDVALHVGQLRTALVARPGLREDSSAARRPPRRRISPSR